MKNPSIISGLVLGCILCLSFLPNDRPVKDRITVDQVQGLWKIVSFTDIEGEVRPWMRSKYKFVVGERFAWMDFDKVAKKFYGSGGGTFHIEDDVYMEVLEYYFADNRVVGDTIVFSCRIEDGMWYHKGSWRTPDGYVFIDEVWEKVVNIEQ